MAFNPSTGLVYIPAQEIPMSYESVKNFQPLTMSWNVGTATTNLPNVKGYLIAWDPVAQKELAGSALHTAAPQSFVLLLPTM